MQVHASVIRATDSAEERHAVFCRSITRSHDFATSPWGRGTINGRNTPSRVLAAVVGDIKAKNGGTTT